MFCPVNSFFNHSLAGILPKFIVGFSKVFGEVRDFHLLHPTLAHEDQVSLHVQDIDTIGGTFNNAAVEFLGTF